MSFPPATRAHHTWCPDGSQVGGAGRQASHKARSETETRTQEPSITLPFAGDDTGSRHRLPLLNRSGWPPTRAVYQDFVQGIEAGPAGFHFGRGFHRNDSATAVDQLKGPR